MRIVAFDLSPTAPGVAYDDAPGTFASTRLVGTPRLSFRARQVLELLDEIHPVLAVIEGYAMGPTRNMAGSRSVAELGGVVRLLLHERGIPYAEVAPACLKKYATGKGNAKKDVVIKAALEQGASIPQRPASGGGREFDDNAADAWWLWQMGIARYAPNDERVRAMPNLNRQSLNSVKWPKLRKAHAA
jgi:hypothetical protein